MPKESKIVAGRTAKGAIKLPQMILRVEELNVFTANNFPHNRQIYAG